MTRAVVGHKYLHELDGKIWNVIVDKIDKTDPKRHEWSGHLAGKQHGLEAGSKCWGYITDLNVVKQ